MAPRFDSVAGARAQAEKTVPRVVFDYIDGAAEDELTARRNRAAFESVTFRPRAGAKTTEPGLATELLGGPMSMPVIIAPGGLVRLMHADGAFGVARAAEDAGLVWVLSSVAGTPLEEAAAGSKGRRWFQLYSTSRERTEELTDRAADAGYEALVVTMDTPALGKRERDATNGIRLPLRVDPRVASRLALQVAVRPRWLAGMARSAFESERAKRSGGGSATAAGASAGRGSPLGMPASPFSWDDIAAIRDLWKGPLLVKGLVTGDDAKLAVDAGVDAIVVSNHGGRQLEGAPATLSALPEVVAAAGGSVPIIVDSGVRRGGDVAKAMALGASAVMIGRAYLYGLAAAGGPGVARVIEILRDELFRTLVLLGCPSVDALDGGYVQVPGVSTE